MSEGGAAPAPVGSAFALERELARRLLNLTALLVAIGAGVFLVANLWIRLWPEAALAFLAFTGALLAWHWARRSENPVQGIQWLVWSAFVGLSGGLLRQGDTQGPAIWWLSALPVLLLQGGAVRAGVTLGGLIVVEALFVEPLSRWLGLARADAFALGAARRDIAITGAIAVDLLVLVMGIRWRRALLADLDAARVEAVNATQVKSRFLANMSHEIRTPLNGIVGATELLRGTRLDEGQRQVLGVLRRSSAALLALVNDVLDLSKLEAGRMRAERVAFDLHDAIHDAAEVFSAQAQAKGVELLAHCTADLPQHCVGDPARLRQILHNLVANAVKFTSEGEVRLFAAPEPGPGGGRWLRVSVRDSGIGMTEAQRASLFEAFEQGDVSTTRRFGGSGLGLAISRELAALLGGRIEVESVPGRGSTFMLLVPLHPVEVEARAAPAAAAAPLDGVQALVVSPNRSLRDDLCELLRRAGAQCDARETIDRAIPSGPAPGDVGARPIVVLCDEKALEAAGLDPARWLDHLEREGRRGVLLVGLAVSARGLPRALLPLYKPALPSRVIDTVRRALGDPPQDSARMDLDPIDQPGARRVLLVEDNPVNQLVAQGLLERLGVHTIIAGDGEQALRLFAEPPAGTRFDLVLMDCQMPTLDGLACTRRLRELEAAEGRARTPIVAMTAQTEAEAGAACRAAGMDDFLPKPVEMAQLMRVMTRWRPDTA
jgi:signal transduction histidine kinase/CheY-like chemotaxis protein